MKSSRRQFLKVAGLSVFALASGAAAAAGEAQAQIAPGHYVPREGMLTAKRWAMVIDTRQFKTEADFRDCVNACDRAHNIPKIPGNKDIIC